MSQAVLFITTGTEEIEAVTIADILRRADISISIISLISDVAVTGSHDIIIMADDLFDDFDFSKTEMFILPGGTMNYGKHEGLKSLFLKEAQDDKYLAALCAAPAILGAWGLLDGKNATCYPGYEEHLGSATYHPELPVVVDGNITTGKGPAFAIEFTLQLVEILKGSDERARVANALLLQA